MIEGLHADLTLSSCTKSLLVSGKFKSLHLIRLRGSNRGIDLMLAQSLEQIVRNVYPDDLCLAQRIF